MLVAILLLFPVTESRTVAPPVRGWLVTSHYLSTGGCVAYRSAPAPQFNFTTGVGRLLFTASANSCPKVYGAGYFDDSAGATVIIPLHMHSGPRHVSTGLNITFNASESLKIGPRCPLVLNSSGYGSDFCRAGAGYRVVVRAIVFDVTNGTYFPWTPTQASIVFGNGSYEQNYTSCQKYTCTYQNASSGNLTSPSVTKCAGRVTFYANGTASGTHRYQLLILISASYGVECYSYTRCVADSRIDFATGRNSFQLASIGIT